MQIAAALAQPTNQRGIGGVMQNLTPVLQEQMQARRVADEQKQSLIQRYMMDRARLTTEKQKALLGNEDQTDQLLLRADIAKQQADARAQAQQSALVAVRDANGNTMYIPRAQYEKMLSEFAPQLGGAQPQGTVAAPGAQPQGAAAPSRRATPEELRTLPHVTPGAPPPNLPDGTLVISPDGFVKIYRKPR
jgi:hypothetical protein